MEAGEGFEGKVALVTGGANGLGRATVERLAAGGAKVVVADVEELPGLEVAAATGGEFVLTDVTDPAASEAAVTLAVEKFGGLDIAFLNAGISTGCGLVDTFDLEKYRRAMSVNLDGVVFGLNAVVPAIRERGSGAIVATSSLAGLTPVPFDPVYAANKHAVVGLVRSMGPVLAADGIRFNGICPGFADTRIISGFRDALVEGGVPVIPVEKVVDAVIDLFATDASGECVFVQAGLDAQQFRFRGVPGPRPD
jgi:NAD(P)-dependent dehydrogenase (short-subunit alcohol dehydrogenase family)